MNGQTIFSPVEQVDEIQSIDDVANALTELGLHGSAKRITSLNNLTADDLGEDLPLTFTSALSFLEFSKCKYFEIEPQMALSDAGEIHAYWKLTNGDRVYIDFLNNKEFLYFINTSNNSYRDTTTLDYIVHRLTDSKVSKC